MSSPTDILNKLFKEIKPPAEFIQRKKKKFKDLIQMRF